MTHPGHDEAVAASLGAFARERLEREPFDDAASRRQLLERASRSRRSASRFRPTWVLVPAGALVALLVVLGLLPKRLDYAVEGVRASGPYVNASADRSARVRFSDDSVVEVKKGSQVRVEETTHRGARVLLERGAADVHVVHRGKTDWTFVAGPCEVLVTGTRFDLAWDPTRELFELKLREGSVEVKTPLSPARVTLSAGQVLRADLARRSMTTSDAANEAASSHDQALPAPAGVPTPVETQPPAAPTGAKANVSPAVPWSKLVAEGQFKVVLAQAEARGIGRCVAGCSASDLSALADAARYSGRTEVAEQSLQALRSRFAGESAARGAACLLGRLRETRGASSDAKTWYERYLAESPGGSYASEALAGKMRTTLAVSGPAAAEPIAREYLRLYPTGVHAGTARGILGSR
jgi:hypothetical protein